ncbi:MAG: torD [Proteobacteria bacterium]|nr:torD [Pseudomonadota bacterium]
MITATVSINQPQGVLPVADAEESGARSALYAVLSHLFIAAPTQPLLQQIAGSRQAIADDQSALALAWNRLCDAARDADAATVCHEFDEVFVTTGRPPVSLYASSYMAGRQRGQLLAELREDLRQMGFERSADSNEYEDHLSALCDVMRGLIVDEAAAADAFAAQQVFFRNYFAPWYERVCTAIGSAEQAAFYRPVAKFAHAFFANESEYFELA